MRNISLNKVVLLFTSILMLSPLSNAADFDFNSQSRAKYDLARDKLSKGPEVVSLVNITTGMTVLDVFGGGGYYSEIIADKVGDSGKVYLHNNQAYLPYIEKELVARLKDNRLENVLRYDREAGDLALSHNKFDVAFHILGYHDLYHKTDGWDVNKDSFLKQLLPAIKQGGKLVIVDHSAIEGSKTKHSQDLHRIDKQYVIDELKQYGLKLTIDSTLLRNEKDTRMVSPFKAEIRRKTDRFVLVFEKI